MGRAASLAALARGEERFAQSAGGRPAMHRYRKSLMVALIEPFTI